MLSIGSLSSASCAANYFIKGGEGQIAGYYADQKESSQWGGGAKEILGLPDGQVDQERFEALLAGKVSDTQTLGRKRNGVLEHDPGRDFTFSLPKSASLLMLGPLREKVEAAAMRSVITTMNYYETHLAQTKIHDKETGKQPKTGGQKILYAAFPDFLSRANDPQFHIHVPVMNIAVGEDGKTRSLNYDLAYKYRNLLGNIQRAEFAKDLKALGLSLKPAGKNGLWELEGASPDLLKHFSKRRHDMVRQAPHKVNDPAAMARMAIITRPAKQHIDKDQLHARWQTEFKERGTSIEAYTQAVLNAPQRDKDDLSPKAALNYAVSHMSETQALLDRFELLKHAMIYSYGNVDIKTMEAELSRRVEKDDLLISEDERWLKPGKTHRLEQQLIGELGKGHLQAKVLSTQNFEREAHKLEGFTPGQKEAARLILKDADRFDAVNGTAGTGKTYLLEKTIPILKAMGYEIIGMAPTDKAVEGLTKTGVFDQTLTVQKFHHAPRGGSKTVLVVDEAGMVGNEKFHSIMSYANSKNMPRVVFLGDSGQLPPIEAGRPFALLIENGLRTVHMDDIIRQKKDHHKKAVLELSQHKLRDAFQSYNKEIHEVPREELESYTLKLRQKMDDPSIIVNTNAQREAINKSISAEKGHEPYSGPAHKQKIWRPFYMTKAEKMRASNYEGASHIRFGRDVGKDFKKGEIYRITKVDHERAELILKSGRTLKAYRPARRGSGDSFTQVYKQSEIILRKGDKVKFYQPFKKLGVSRNDYADITSLSKDRVVLKLNNHKSIAIKPGHRMLGHIDHAWANTIYSFQGVTVKDNIAIMKADNNPLNTLEAFYVAGSRHTNNIAIVTDDKDRLLRVISEKLDLAKERIEFKEPRKMHLVDAQSIMAQEQQSKPKETEKTSKIEKSRQTEREQEIQKSQEVEPDKIQRQRERGGRGR